MSNITIGLDFGTHQTKICIENKEDKLNPIYSFFPFTDLDGNKSIILPSIVQINKDDTLSYGFVDRPKSKYGRKFFFIKDMPEYPVEQKDLFNNTITKPVKPSILEYSKIPEGVDKEDFLSQYEEADKSYKLQMSLWEQKKEAESKLKERSKDLECSEKNSIQNWYKWQNFSQKNYRMIYRYFKQSTFSDYEWKCTIPASYLTVWFLSYVLFQIEDVYGNDFAIQMGIPTGSDNFEEKKEKAVSFLLTAFHLVEDVFKNDLERFLATPYEELIKLTTFLPFSSSEKMLYSLLIFPEAYAALKSLTHQRRIEQGMNLMVDIGGGTTDISFFLVVDGKPMIYDYSSIPYAINYIIELSQPNRSDRFDDNINLDDIEKDSLAKGTEQYFSHLAKAIECIVQKLRKSFRLTGYPMNRLTDALKNRLLIYSGGGSIYSDLRKPVGYFTDVKYINPRVWDGMTIVDVQKYVSLCPIISTAVGLAISEENDNVQMSTTEEIFKHLEGTYQKVERTRQVWI